MSEQILEEIAPLIQQTVDFASKRGYENIKAQHLEDFEDPISMERKQDGVTFVPDVTAYKHGKKCYFVVALKGGDVTQTVSKWRLLETLANMRGSKLFLMVPRGNFRFTNDLVSTYNINAELIKL